MTTHDKATNTLHIDLQSLGFTPNQITTYLTLLRFGPQKAGELIQKTKLQRSVVYTCLEDLIHRNLVSENTTESVSVFNAKDPKELIREQESRLRLTEKIAKELQAEKAVLKHEAYVYQGDNIVSVVADKSLEAKKGETVYFFGSSKFGVQAHMEKYWKNYHETRVKNKIRAKILYDRFTKEDIIRDRNTLKDCEARYLPIDVEIPISFNIWQDHVAILVPGDNPPTVFFIKNRDTADALVEYFNYLWRQTKA